MAQRTELGLASLVIAYLFIPYNTLNCAYKTFCRYD